MRSSISCLALTIFSAAMTDACADPVPPRSFIDGAGAILPIEGSFMIRKGDDLVPDPWPFASSEVTFFCAKPAWAAYGCNGKFGSLNGTTSTFALRGLMVAGSDGSTHPIVSASDNRLQVESGLLSPGASNMAIGSWHAAMLQKLLSVCGR